MNKKILAISLVAVAAIAVSVGTTIALNKNTFESFSRVQADTKSIVLTKSNLQNVLEDEGQGVFELHGKCAYDTTRDYAITDGSTYGETIHIGGDHIFTISSSDYWYFMMTVKIKGISSMNSFVSITYSGSFDGITSVDRTIDDFEYPSWDAEDESLSLSVFEWNDNSGYSNGQTMKYSSITIDQISISYIC